MKSDGRNKTVETFDRRPMRAVVSLGSNLGDRADNLSRAIASLSRLPRTRLVRTSSVLETEPVDVPEEFRALKFLNQTALFETGLAPEDFARRMHAIEDDMGRVRTIRNAPRVIDLDLIDFGGLVRQTPELTLPHPRAKARAFVLEPLRELGLALGPSTPEWSVADVRAELARGCRVLLFTRHAERPKIDNEDPSFGDALPLTAEGERTSRELGRMLKGAAETVQFRASPLKRTVLTARLMAEGMGIERPEIVEDASIGNGSAFIASEAEVWELFRDGAFFSEMIDYLQRGEQRGFAPLAAAADAFEAYALDKFTAQLGVFATHDVYLVAYLHARGVKTDFVYENWPRFLDMAAVVLDRNGTRRYGFVRAGLSSLCCGVPVD